MPPTAKANTMEREEFDTLTSASSEQAAAYIRQTYQVRDNLIVSLGKFEGQHFSAPYWYAHTLEFLEDFTSTIEDGEELDCFEISELERSVFSLDPNDRFAALAIDFQGSIQVDFYSSKDQIPGEII